MWRFRVVEIIVTALLVPVAVLGQAAGRLDTTFGSGGRVLTAISSGDDRARAIVVQPDGSLLVAGRSALSIEVSRFALARYTAAGALDPAFGNGGVVLTPVSGLRSEIRALAVQTDGRIVAAGGGGYTVLARYHADGSLDASFGDGGLVNAGPTGAATGVGAANAVALQPDGRIITAAQDLSYQQFSLLRFNPDGTLDDSFGFAGRAYIPLPAGRRGFPEALALQPDGRIVVAGSSLVGGYGQTADFTVARVNPDGSVDSSFGTDGVVRTPIGDPSNDVDLALALLLLPDGKLVVGGSSHENFALVRYLSDGTLDADFGAGGIVTNYSGGIVTNYGSIDGAGAVLQPDGKIVLAASGIDQAGRVGFGIARYNPDGSPDVSFASGGIATTVFGSPPSRATALALQPDGRLVAAGWVFDKTLRGTFALARYHGLEPALAGDCPPQPQTCRHAEKALLLVKDAPDDSKDRLLWKWMKGAATPSEVGDPTATSDYVLCLYAESASTLIGAGALAIPAGAPRWQPLGDKGYKFKDPSGQPAGVQAAVLKGSQLAKAKLLVKAKGASMPDPFLPLPLPLTAQLINSASGLCWSASFTSGDTTANSDKQFKAKTD